MDFKTMIRVMVIFSLLVPTIWAEEERGYLRIFNAVNRGEGSLQVRVNRESLSPEGYALGDLTGGIPLKPGVYRINFEREGTLPARTQLTVHARETTVLIAYVEASDRGDEIRTFRLKPREVTDSRMVTLVSVAGSPNLKPEVRQVDRRWRAYSLERLKPLGFENLQPSAYLTLRCQGREFTTRSLGESGHAVIVFYEDEQGGLRMKSYLDYVYGKTFGP
ncbi:MAG: hypothetical protein QM627_09525 [Luteolibacter sp.]